MRVLDVAAGTGNARSQQPSTVEYFKARYGPTIAARANATKTGRESEFDEALDQFCDEWNRGTADNARFEKEYLLAVGARTDR